MVVVPPILCIVAVFAFSNIRREVSSELGGRYRSSSRQSEDICSIFIHTHSQIPFRNDPSSRSLVDTQKFSSSPDSDPML